MQKKRLFVVIWHCHRADVCVAVHNLGLWQLSICTAHRVRRVWLPSNLHIFPENHKILPLHPKRAIIFGLIITQNSSLHTSQRWFQISVRHTVSICFNTHCTLSTSNFAQRRGCLSQRGDLSLQALGLIENSELTEPHWQFQLPSTPGKKKTPNCCRFHHTKLTQESSDFNLRCSLPFALSMWIADLHHPEILTRSHICCYRLQVQNGVPEEHPSLLELRARPYYILCVGISLYAHLLCLSF